MSEHENNFITAMPYYAGQPTSMPFFDQSRNITAATAGATIEVVIVSFNTRHLLQPCIESLQGCLLPLRVRVVDNNSPDGSAAMVAETFPEVALTRLRSNTGFAAANNIALTQLLATPSDEASRYVLLLNPDTIVQHGAIEHLAAFLDQHPRVALAAPRLLNIDGTYQPAAFRFPTLAMTTLDLFPPGEVLPGRFYHSWWNGRYPQEATATVPFPIDHPLGACMLVRREALEAIGLFDEQFFIYAEEVDLCYRLRQARWAIWQVPQAHVIHVGGASTRQFRQRMFVELYRSRARFLAKHYPPATQRLHQAVTRAGMLRLALQAWMQYWRGRIDKLGLQARLWACSEIWRL